MPAKPHHRRRLHRQDPISPPGDAAGKSRWTLEHEHWILAAVLLSVAVVHTSGIYGVFVFDDRSLADNPSLQQFGSFDWFRLTKRPITTATFAANFTLFGPTPTSCHLLNIAIHLGAVGCLFVLLRRSILLWRSETEPTDAINIAAGVSLLWGVHPLCTAAVTYLVQRAESLASLGILLCLLAWSLAFSNEYPQSTRFAVNGRDRERSLWALVAVAAAYLAFGSKEMSAGLPLIVMLYDRVFLAKSWHPLLRRIAWYAALVMPLMVGGFMMLPGLIGNGRNTIGLNIDGLTPWAYFTSQPIVFAQYLRLSVFPIWQSLDYGWLPSHEPRWQFLGLVGWLLIGVATVALWRTSRPLAFTVLTALLVLAPTSTILPFQDIIFEHRFYLPLACLLAGVGSWIAAIAFRRDDTSASRSRWILATVMLSAGFSWLTISRNLDYTSAARIHEVDTQNHPDNPRAWYGLATTAVLTRPEPKIEMLRRAIDLSAARDFFYAGTDYKWPRDLADTLFLSGRVSESREYYQLALRHSYDELQETEVLFQLAMVASIEGRVDDAEQLFQQTLAGDRAIRDQVRAAYLAHRARSDLPTP